MKSLRRTTAIILALLISTVTALSFPTSAATKKKPAAPKKLTVANTAKGVKVSWNKVKGASKYLVKYKLSTAKSYKTAYKGKKTSFTDDNLAPGKVYSFKVRVYKNKKWSAYTKAKKIMFLDRPQLNAEELLDMDGITLEWDKGKGAKLYKIYRSLKSKNSYKKIAEVKASDSHIIYKDRAISKDYIESYKYYIVAYNGSYKSAKSNVDYDVYGYYVSGQPLKVTISKGQVYGDIREKIDTYAAFVPELKSVTWTSSAPSIAKVNSNGIITGVKKGVATISASGKYEGSTHTIKIEVTVK
ncbi:MAG: Ig-like domain-containing protein [Ruminococcus sp.]|nr:Ig-like domain-containing protein [Ruminococcus sp.]